MFVRVGTFPVKPGALEALRERYESECVPLVRAAPGSLECAILEPVDAGAPAVVATVWRREQDALAYESSGTAADVVARVREFFAGPPTLTSYRINRPA